MWDRDSGWDDDLLGKVSLVPTSGRISQWLKLKHGSLMVRLSAVCAPSLQGPLCQRYAATPTYEEVIGYAREKQGGAGPGPAPPDGVRVTSSSHARL